MFICLKFCISFQLGQIDDFLNNTVGKAHSASSMEKKVSDFPAPSRDVTNQTLPGREEFDYFRPGRVWLVTSRLRRER